MTSQEFLATIKPYVIADMKKTPFILASLTTAQAIIESGWGKSGLTSKANNLFGIKGTYNGQSVTMRTREVYNGQTVYVNAAFRKYPSWAESIADHSKFLSTKRYTKLHNLKDYKLACKYIKEAGYATDPNYTSVLIKTIETYKLYEWDKEAIGNTSTTSSNTPKVVTPQTTTKKTTYQYTSDGKRIVDTTKDATGATLYIVSVVSRNLKIGDVGEDVRAVQLALEKGNWYVEGDYVNLCTPMVYDEPTRDAVLRFQRANGLTVDGICGPKTADKLGV